MRTESELISVGALNAGSVCAQAHVVDSDSEALEVAGRIGQALAQDAAERDRQRRLPWTEVETLSASGLLGITVPRRFGGPDVSAVTLAEVVRLISAGDSNVGQIPQSHFTFLHALRELGTDDQQRFFFSPRRGPVVVSATPR